MNDSSNFSSELQRKFTEASQLKSDEEVVAYLDRECGENEVEKEQLLRMVAAAKGGAYSELLTARKRLSKFQAVVKQAASKQRFQEDSDTPPPQIERYELLAKLGEGAMGTVYLAQQLTPINRQVAIKVIKPEMNSRQVLARFEREKQTLASLEHPNICQIYDAGETESGLPFLAMELVRGTTIEKYCREQRLPMLERIRLMVDVCRAVDYAHEFGIVHRDLKPANVLVKQVNGSPVVKVIDFGVAKALENDPSGPDYRTYFRQLVGTLMYMSPEQVDMDTPSIDARSDVYSLGALFYELVTGYPPLHAATGSSENLLKRIREEVPILASKRIKGNRSQSPEETEKAIGISASELSTWERSAKGDLDTVLSVCLRKSSDERYPSASALAEDLQRIIDGQPIHGKRQHLRTLVRRTKKIAPVAAIVSLAAIVTWLMVRTSPTPQESTVIPAQAGVASPAPDVAKREADLLEASRLQNMLSAYRNRDLATIHQILDSDDNASATSATLTSKISSESDGPSLQKFLRTLSAPEPVLRMDNGSPVHAIAVSPNHQFVVAACDDRYARIWSLVDGRLVGSLGPHAGSVTATLFSADGQRLLTGDQEGVLTIWDSTALETLDLTNQPPVTYRSESHDTGIQSLAISPDQEKIAVGYRYDPVCVYDFEGNLQARFDHWQKYTRNHSVLFSDDSQSVYVSDRHGARVDRLDVETKNSLWYAKASLDPPIAVYFPHGTIRHKKSLFYVTPIDIHEMDIETGAVLSRAPLNWSKASSMAMSPGGEMLVTGHALGQCMIHATTGDSPMTFTPQGAGWVHALHKQTPDSFVTGIHFLDEQRLLTCGDDGYVQLWEMNHLRITENEFPVALPMVRHSNRGTITEVWYEDEPQGIVLRQTDVNDGFFLPLKLSVPDFGDIRITYSSPHEFLANPPLAVDSQHRLFAFPTESGIQVVNLPNGDLQAQVKCEQGVPKTLLMSNDGEFIAGLFKDRLKIWKLSADRLTEVADFSLQPYIPIDLSSGFCICEEGDKVLLGTEGKMLCIDTRSGKLVKEWSVSGGFEFCVSDSERLIAIADLAGMRVYDRNTNELLFRNNVVGSKLLKFSDHESILLGCTAQQQIKAWHIPTESDLGAIFQADQNEIIYGFQLTTASLLMVDLIRVKDRHRYFKVTGRKPSRSTESE